MCIKVWWVRFADFILFFLNTQCLALLILSHFLKYPMEMKVRPNYFISIGYFKNGGVGVGRGFK